ncbi:hypothetical protein NIE88_16320 [Sporolactobacillus shoreicorticis]|uniref:Uncharacterized protein n=1 Tax=Sporolactobacillus shoreicorticis TaxID=1923877 RepID=A0ABW5SAN4_9BACL|nr:hypothetical protein [Sporolactobacillus shoreicorticis]MCO7127336.1 hypothetical protein [Sporolactobacillus shoreicorticis]
MPQITKGGKFVFGWSKINNDLTMQLFKMAIDEYDITSEGKVYLISGSKKTGGFCVSKKGLLANSKIGNVLTDLPLLIDYQTDEGKFVNYKGRLYCWLSVSKTGVLQFSDALLNTLSLKANDKLLSIRGSDIAFVMGAKGPLIERANSFEENIDVY